MRLFSILSLTFVFFLWFGTSSLAQTGTQSQPNTSSSATNGYHLLKKFEIGGEGGWDYLFADSAMRRLYISRSIHVLVLDLDTGASVGEIPDTKGVHGIAIAADLGRGFTSNGQDNSVTMFETKGLKILGQVKVGTNPDAIIYDPVTHRVFAFNRGSSDVTAIEAADGKIAGRIDLGGHPEFAAPDGKGRMFVNLDDKSEVVVLDAEKLAVKARWPVTPGEDPSGMAIDQKHHRLFTACGNRKMVVLNTDSGKVITSLPIGGGVDAAGFDPETQMAFSSNGEGTLTVIKEESGDKFQVMETVPTQRGARTMTLDTKTHRVYLATAQFGPAPAPTAEHPHPRPSILPNSFVILVFGK